VVVQRRRERRRSAVSKILWLGCLVLLLLAPASPAAPRQAPSGGAGPELLFRARFDGPSADADYSRGDPRSSLERALAGTPGREGRGGALLLRDGERCDYAAAGNLDLSEGTISLWVRPESWRDDEGRFQKFFEISGLEGGRPFSLYVDSPPAPGAARLVVIVGYPQSVDHRLYQIQAAADWRPGRWQKIDVTWSARRLAIYVNGRPGESLEIRDPQFPRLADARFAVVPIHQVGDGRYHNAKDRSAIDQIEIRRGALQPDQVLERHLADVEEPLPPPLVRVPRSDDVLGIDGELSEPAWEEASRIPLLADEETGFAGPRAAQARLLYRSEALYVGFSSDRALRASGKGDTEDAYLLRLAAAAGPAAEWSLGAAGARRRGGDGHLAPDPTVGFASGRRADVFTAEVAIPWAAAGWAAPRPGDEWHADLGRRWARASGVSFGVRWAPDVREPGAKPRGRLVFGDVGDGAVLALSDRLCCGWLEAEASSRAGGKLRIEMEERGTDGFERSGELAPTLRVASPLDVREHGRLSVVLRDEKKREAQTLALRVLRRALLHVTPLPKPEEGRLGLDVELSSVATDWLGEGASADARLRVSVQGPEGAPALGEAPVRAAAETLWLPFSFREGEHRLAYALERAAGQPPLETQTRLDVPALPWAGNRIGEGDEVLEPWTPIGYEAPDTLSVWGRRYAFDGPLLRSVTQRGRELLRGAITLELRTERGRGRFRSLSAEQRRRDPQRAEFEGSGDFGAAGMNVRWSTWTEYDGLTHVSLTLEPPDGGIRVDSLSLVIPLREDVVRYLRGGRQGGQIRTGRVEWNGLHWRSGFEPFLWVSNEEEGFLYLSESDANWVYADGTPVVSVRGGPGARIELQPIQRAVRVERTLRYEFAFQATPVKPMAADHREWNFGSQPVARHQNALNWFPGFASQEGLFEPVRPEALRRADAEWRDRGVRVLYFGTTSATPDHNPTFDLFQALWRGAWAASFPNTSGAATAFRDEYPEAYSLVGVCPGAKSFQDMLVHQVQGLLREIGAAGIYTDTDDLFADDNARHGHGFMDVFGRSGFTWPFLDKRRFAKRLAAVVRQTGPGRRHWMSHAHARLVPPVHAFADSFLPGEELGGAVRANPWFYTDVLDEAAWRVEYRGESSGLVHVLLPEFATVAPGMLREVSESLLGLAAVNDVNVDNGFVDVAAIGEYWDLRRRLKLLDAEFVGHWRSDALVRAEPETTRASAYRTAEGLVIPVRNAASTAQDVRLQVDLERAGLRGRLRARDERRGRSLPIEDGRVVVPLGGRSYTFVSLRAED
jgi:hypothetical protein